MYRVCFLQAVSQAKDAHGQSSPKRSPSQKSQAAPVGDNEGEGEGDDGVVEAESVHSKEEKSSQQVHHQPSTTMICWQALGCQGVGMSGQQNSLVAVLRRTFKIGSAISSRSGPDPTTVDGSTDFLSATYPQVRWTQLYDGDAKVVSTTTLEYEFLIPPVKTNG